MSVVTIEYEFYNRRNPKCRACEFWKAEDRMFDYYGECVSQESKVKHKWNRAHNMKACMMFEKYSE